ncbi:MAG: phosphotransferase [Lysobacteraceae bacterium]|nr:MAG: phosphotransferase [Xanthomonadaceae bacterium]
MIDRDAIEAMIPHKGAMCLWDAVTDWDGRRIRLRGRSHRDPDNPLRRGGRLNAVHLCEYGAQAMAVHGGVLGVAGGGSAKAGVLVALRDVRLCVAWIDDLPGDLVCEAELLADSPTSQQYAFRILHDDGIIAEGRAAVMLQG